jgi:expansin (peptidoglycan-binding protein)
MPGTRADSTCRPTGARGTPARRSAYLALIALVACETTSDSATDPDTDAAADGSASDAPSTVDGANDAANQADAASGPDAATSGPLCRNAGSRAGEGTYYDADGTGNCSFARDDSRPLRVAAMNDPDWEGSAVCGSCAAVRGPEGSVTVRIVDRCPECASGDLDLSPDAFREIAPLERGRVPIEWSEVPCDVDGPAVFHVKDGSNPWWAAYQLRNHRHRVVSIEVVGEDGSARALRRESYNYFIDEDAPGEHTHLRAIDVYGSRVEADVAVIMETETAAAAQFDACTP